jgi:hypothetical protein
MLYGPWAWSTDSAIEKDQDAYIYFDEEDTCLFYDLDFNLLEEASEICVWYINTETKQLMIAIPS